MSHRMCSYMSSMCTAGFLHDQKGLWAYGLISSVKWSWIETQHTLYSELNEKYAFHFVDEHMQLGSLGL